MCQVNVLTRAVHPLYAMRGLENLALIDLYPLGMRRLRIFQLMLWVISSPGRTLAAKKQHKEQNEKKEGEKISLLGPMKKEQRHEQIFKFFRTFCQTREREREKCRRSTKAQSHKISIQKQVNNNKNRKSTARN